MNSWQIFSSTDIAARSASTASAGGGAGGGAAVVLGAAEPTGAGARVPVGADEAGVDVGDPAHPATKLTSPSASAARFIPHDLGPGVRRRCGPPRRLVRS